MKTIRKALRWLRPEGVPRDALLAFVPFALLLLSLLSLGLYQAVRPDATSSLGKIIFVFWAVVIVFVSLPAMVRFALASRPPKP